MYILGLCRRSPALMSSGIFSTRPSLESSPLDHLLLPLRSSLAWSDLYMTIYWRLPLFDTHLASSRCCYPLLPARGMLNPGWNFNNSAANLPLDILVAFRCPSSASSAVVPQTRGLLFRFLHLQLPKLFQQSMQKVPQLLILVFSYMLNFVQTI